MSKMMPSDVKMHSQMQLPWRKCLHESWWLSFWTFDDVVPA